jgi:DNA-binding MarR family transcriptional regulator
MPERDQIDTSVLEQLLGYNARRVSLAVISQFMEDMAEFKLRPVEFSVLTLIASNPGITARQLCQQLALLPPNLVGLLNTLASRDLIRREPHATDRRATALFLDPRAHQLVKKAQARAVQSDHKVLGQLTATERQTLNSLLKKVYAAPQL